MTSVIILFILVMSFIGYKFHLLSKSGAIAAFLVGTFIFWGTGWQGFLILGLFFVTSSFFSELKSKQKKSIEVEHHRGSRRDYIQVMANGGIASICSFIFVVDGSVIWIYAFITAIACAASDTWASEVGTLSRKKPVYLKTLQRVNKGRSGAFSLVGTVTALCGAAFITYTGLYVFDMYEFETMIIITVIAFIGQWIDTALGAYWQVQYQCQVCQKQTESRSHCGERTKQTYGKRLMQNDIVNVLSITSATMLAILWFW